MDFQFGKVDVELTALATEYKNRELIGDEIAPAVKTPTTNFKYAVWNKANNFTIPQTAVGKTGEFNKVQFSGSFENGAVENHGLTTDVSMQDIKDFEAVGDRDLLARNARSLRNVMLLRREVSIAQKVQDTNNYAASTAYTASNSWANTSSDPLKDIEDAIVKAIVPFNRMWFSLDAWLALKRHPKVIARLFPHTTSTVASVKEADIAAELGLEKVVVSKSVRVNTAEPGKTPVMSDVFNSSAGLYVYGEQTFINSQMNFLTQVFLPQRENGGNFGRLTVVLEELKFGEYGMGGISVRIGEQLTLISQGKDLGYLFKDVTKTA
jgi:hypothetical protein